MDISSTWIRVVATVFQSVTTLGSIRQPFIARKSPSSYLGEAELQRVQSISRIPIYITGGLGTNEKLPLKDRIVMTTALNRSYHFFRTTSLLFTGLFDWDMKKTENLGPHCWTTKPGNVLMGWFNFSTYTTSPRIQSTIWNLAWFFYSAYPTTHAIVEWCWVFPVQLRVQKEEPLSIFEKQK